MEADRATEGLDPEQRAAVLAPVGPVLVVAPAGSGKTRVLTRRIAHRLADGSATHLHLLVLTFTRQAAWELTRRLGRLGVRERLTVGTFHAVALQVLREQAEISRRPAPTVLDRPIELLRELPRLPIDAAVLATEAEWAGSRGVTSERYEAELALTSRRPAAPPSRVAEGLARYESAKRARRLLDFGDLLSHGARLAEHDPGARRLLQWRFRHVHVDEYQDVNPAQHRLLRAWTTMDDLFVVGDPHQSIYGWNGADPALLHRFTDEHPGSTVIRLTTTYRCPPQVVAVAHEILDANGQWSPRPASALLEGPAPEVHAFADELAEARGVATLVRRSRSIGAPWRSIAVLARTHALLDPVRSALTAAGIPVTPLGARRDASPTPDDRPLDDDEPRPADADGVVLATFHAAKGLEWSTVVIVAAETGVMPMAGISPAQRAEEARLAYVACTRSRRALHLTWARSRDGRRPTLSPWLASLDLQAATEPAPATEPPPGLLAARAQMGRHDADPVRVALSAWRDHVALGGRVEAVAVLPDAAIDALVAHRPTDPEQVASVAGLGPVLARRYGEAIADVVALALREAG